MSSRWETCGSAVETGLTVGALLRGITFRLSTEEFSWAPATMGEAELTFLLFFLPSLSPLSFDLFLLTLAIPVGVPAVLTTGRFSGSLWRLCCRGCAIGIMVMKVGTEMSLDLSVVFLTTSSEEGGGTFLLFFLPPFLIPLVLALRGIMVVFVLAERELSSAGFFWTFIDGVVEGVSLSIAGSSFMTSLEGSSFPLSSYSLSPALFVLDWSCLCDSLRKLLRAMTSPGLLPEGETAALSSVLTPASAFCFLLFPFPLCFLGVFFFFPLFFLFFFSELWVSLSESWVELCEVETVARTLMKSSAAVTTFVSVGCSGPGMVDWVGLSGFSSSSVFLDSLFLGGANVSTSMTSIPPKSYGTASCSRAMGSFSYRLQLWKKRGIKGAGGGGG